LPADDTRGGVLVAWNSSELDVSRITFDSYALTGEVKTKDNCHWWLTVVYGPQSTTEKIQFLTQLSERRALCPGSWLVLGDFDMILRAADKNNLNLNRRSMSRFRDFVNEHELRDIYMHGRLYTLSNEREVPTLSRIDRALASVDWDLAYPDNILVVEYF
jgi:hypothetical protein